MNRFLSYVLKCHAGMSASFYVLFRPGETICTAQFPLSLRVTRHFFVTRRIRLLNNAVFSTSTIKPYRRIVANKINTYVLFYQTIFRVETLFFLIKLTSSGRRKTGRYYMFIVYRATGHDVCIRYKQLLVNFCRNTNSE